MSRRVPLDSTDPAPSPEPTRAPDRRALLVLVGIWLAWAVCLLTYQELVVARLEPARP